MNDLFLGYGPEIITGLTGVVPNDYGLATSLYIANLAKEYNIELAQSLGIDISTPDKYREFVKSNPKAYKHPILKHQLGYGLLSPILGGIIQAHIIKNKLNRLQSMDSSEINNKRNFDMFDEILKAYKVCEDKTAFLSGMVPEEVRPELLAALDVEDEAKFNSLIATVQLEPTVAPEEEKAIEPNESEIQVGEQPEVADTTADVPAEAVNSAVEQVTDVSALPDGEITTLTDEQIETIAPTINAVADMTDQIQDLENLDQIPEGLKEGVEIWKDADEDFSVRIITETVKRLYHGDFSEAKDVTSGEIIATGAEVAKELHDKGEHKTTLTKGIEEVQQDLKVMDLADLYSILGELHTLKDSVINFVDFIAEKDDLGLSPSKKKELVDEILNNGLFVDSTDEFRKDVAETLNSAADYSAKDMSTRLSIFKDFSEGFEEHISPLSDGACECLECVTEKEEEKPEAAPEAEAEGEKVSKETVEIAKEAGTFDKAIEMVEDRIEELQEDDGVVEKFAQFSMDCAVQTAKDNGLDPNMYMSMLYNNSVQRTPYQQKVIDKIMKRNRAINRPFFVKPFQAVFTGAPGSARWDKKYGALDDIGTQVAYTMPNMLGQAGKALDQKYGTDTYGQLGSDLGEWMLANKLDQGTIRHFSESEDFSDDKRIARLYRSAIRGAKLTPAQYAILQSKGMLPSINLNDRNLNIKLTKLDSSCGDKSEVEMDCSNKKDFAEGEAPAEEQISQEVIDNALSNDDQIRALVEKYKMLPTIEAKDQMKADMQTLGFTEDVIAMIENYAEGNFSAEEGTKSGDASEETQSEVCPNCGQDPCVCEGQEAETVDVASQVAPELFDELLGPGIGESDPIDGTLPAGEILAPGTDLGHLGTIDQGIPSGEVVPEDDKEVTKIEIVADERDDFEDIMR